MFIVAMLILSLTALAVSAYIENNIRYGAADGVFGASLVNKIYRAAGVARLASAIMSIVWTAVLLFAVIIGLLFK